MSSSDWIGIAVVTVANCIALGSALWILKGVAATAKLMQLLCEKCERTAKIVEDFEEKHNVGKPPITFR